MGSMRYMNIGLGVSVTIIVAGVIVFKDSEPAMQAVALVGMIVGLAVGLGLDTRAQRKSGKRAQ